MSSQITRRHDCGDPTCTESSRIAEAGAAQQRAAAEYANLMADFAQHPERYAHSFTFKVDGVTYVHKSLSARYAQTPLCGFTGDGDSLHGDDAYVTCPDCIAAR